MSDVVWQGLTQADLDRQLNLRARWPNHEAVMQQWSDASAQAKTLGSWQEIAYGAHPLQRLDLALPDRSSGQALPLLVFIHGGYWQSLDKSDFALVAPPFLEAGIAVASLNYRLAPEVPLDAIVTDIAAATARLAEEATSLGLAQRHWVLAGHSAGGHLAIMELLRDRRAVEREGAQPRYAAVSAISGIYDLAPIRLSYQQPVVQLTAAQILDLSPLRQAPLSLPPVLLAVGDQETAEFVRQQDALAAHWRGLGLDIDSKRVAASDHFTVVNCLAAGDHPLTTWLLQACQGKT
ncbi:MAG: alpha/beta hydrolase [Pseudomonadota bacterium]